MQGLETTRRVAVKSVSGGDIRCLEGCQSEIRGGNLENGCRFAKLRRELRWQLFFNGAKEGTSVYNLCSFRSQNGSSGLNRKSHTTHTRSRWFYETSYRHWGNFFQTQRTSN